jgi:hypothetical protein
LDARAVQDRLDDVLGLDGWQDQYTPLPDGSVVCELRCRIGGEWIVKTDVGSPSEQPDGGDRLKAAFSDALKRAAVKFGIGRYLYRLPPQWCDWDAAKRRFVVAPKLPAQPTPAAVSAEPPLDTLTDQELAALAGLLTQKKKTVSAALKSVSCKGSTLADLTRDQYQVLLNKLAKLP